MEELKGFEVFEIKPQIVSKGKKSQRLARTDMIGASVQVAAEGGETNMHSHPHTDSVWIVLEGEATFYGAGEGGSDKVAAKLQKHQGLLLKRATPYWFESSGATPLVILHLTARDPNAKSENSRVNFRPRTRVGSEGAVVVEGKFFGEEKPSAG